MPARQYSPCSSTSWQLTIDLSSDDDLPSGNDNSDGKSDCYPESTDVDMEKVETQDVAVRKSKDCLLKRRNRILGNLIVLQLDTQCCGNSNSYV